MSTTIPTINPSTIQAVRSAETGCVVYIDASAIPAGVQHGRADCRCVKIHGPEELGVHPALDPGLLGRRQRVGRPHDDVRRQAQRRGRAHASGDDNNCNHNGGGNER
ncbi:hypothetical protein PG990_007539 [Apiospora arundinis]